MPGGNIATLILMTQVVFHRRVCRRLRYTFGWTLSEIGGVWGVSPARAHEGCKR